MKRILIYGDSNLWGFNYVENKRFEDKYQWANMLGKYLGNDYNIIQEGLPGRTAGNINDIELYKNGKDMFEAIFRSSSPLDYIIIALGTNDLQKEYNRKAQDIYNDLIWYTEKIKELYSVDKYKERFFNNKFPEIIYILPSNFDYENDAKELYDITSNEERDKLIVLFKNNCKDKYIVLNNVDLIIGDGVHYSIKGQEIVYNEIKKLF